MPTARIVSLLIRATNLTGSALNAAKRDIEGLTGPMAKVGEYAKKILDVKWVSQLLQFMKSLRYAWLAIGAIIGSAVALVINKIKEYQANLKAAGDVMYSFRGSGESLAGTFKNISEAAKSAGVKFSEMASFMEQMGEKFGYLGLTTERVTRTLGALEAAGLTGKQSMKLYADVSTGLQGALEKLLPPLEKQEEAMKRLGITSALLERVQRGDIAAAKELRDRVVNLDDAMAVMADRGGGKKFIEFLNAVIENGKKLTFLDKFRDFMTNLKEFRGLELAPSPSALPGTKMLEAEKYKQQAEASGYAGFLRTAKPVEQVPFVDIIKRASFAQGGLAGLQQQNELLAGYQALGKSLGMFSDITGKSYVVVADTVEQVNSAIQTLHKQDVAMFGLSQALKQGATTKEGKITESDVTEAVKRLAESEGTRSGKTQEYYDAMTDSLIKMLNISSSENQRIDELVARTQSISIQLDALQNKQRISGTAQMGLK